MAEAFCNKQHVVFVNPNTQKKIYSSASLKFCNE